MKNWILFFILSFFLLSAKAYNEQVANPLIKKLESVIPRFKASDPARISIELRLADMLSEKARYLSQKDLDSGCLKCTKGVKERKKALKLYTKNIHKIKSIHQKSKVMIEIGHTYELLKKPQKAILFYKKIPKITKNKTHLSEAYFSLAELYFKLQSFNQAFFYYQKLSKNKSFKNYFFSVYRQAWSLYNLKKRKKAILILKKLIKELKDSKKDENLSFAKEVLRDLSTFMSQDNSLEKKDIKEFYQMSLDTRQALDDLSYLAQELESLGRNSMSLFTWQFIYKKETSKIKRMESLIRFVDLKRLEARYEEALESYKKTLDLFSQSSCHQKKSCPEIETRIRKFILDWNHGEKKKPSLNLIQAYESYLKVFQNDLDMKFWLAQNYKLQKKYKASVYLYAQVFNEIKIKKLKFKKIKNMGLEKILLIMLENAELSQKKKLLKESYYFYLKNSLTQTKKLEVSYQLAYLYYQNKNYEKAALGFRKIALFEKKASHKSLQIKSADLALDALVLMKKDRLIELWSQEFKAKFPSKKKEYEKLIINSQLNQIQALSQTDVKKAYELMKGFLYKEASLKDKIKYLKNKVVIEKKIGLFSSLNKSLNQLYAFKKQVSKKDLKWILGEKLLLAEMFLNFNEAYLLLSKYSKYYQISEVEKLIKLSLFAKMTAKDSKAYDRLFIQKSKNKKEKKAMAYRLIQESKNPFSEFESYKNFFKDSPQLYKRLFRESLFRLKNPEIKKNIKKYQKDEILKNSPLMLVFWREGFLKELFSLDETIKKHKLSDKNLKKSILQRLKMIQGLEKKANDSIKKQDWITQVISFYLLFSHYKNFHSEILSLPMPNGLNEAEQMQYMSILNEQAKPYKLQSEAFSKKYQELWGQKKALLNLKNLKKYFNSSFVEKINQLLKKLISFTPEKNKKLVAKIANSVLKIKFKDVKKDLDINWLQGKRKEAMRMNQKNPYNRQAIKQLIYLSKLENNQALTEYLKERLKFLDSRRKKP